MPDIGWSLGTFTERKRRRKCYKRLLKTKSGFLSHIWRHWDPASFKFKRTLVCSLLAPWEHICFVSPCPRNFWQRSLISSRPREQKVLWIHVFTADVERCGLKYVDRGKYAHDSLGYWQTLTKSYFKHWGKNWYYYILEILTFCQRPIERQAQTCTSSVWPHFAGSVFLGRMVVKILLKISRYFLCDLI